MKTISDAGSVATERDILGRKEFTGLLQFFSEAGDGLSFYLGWPEVRNNAHRDEAILAKDLLQPIAHLAEKQFATGLAADVKKLKQRVERVRSEPSRLQVVFACSAQDVWYEVDLPCHVSSNAVEIGQYFRIVPLISALQRTRPYGVVLIEAGKARVLTVRGAEIEETKDAIESVDLSLHADDGRVGWSDHIDRNQQAHERAFLKYVADQIREFTRANQLDTVIVGCREDLWSDLRSQIDKPGTLRVETFHLPNYSIGDAEIVKHAEPVFLSLERTEIENLLRSVQETPARSAVGANDVLASLSNGNARKVVLGALTHEVASECRVCGHVSPEKVGSCPVCGGSNIGHLALDEAVLRKSVFSGADVVMAEAAGVSFNGVTALLRY